MTRLPNRSQGGQLLSASRPAMGSFFEVKLPASYPGAMSLADAALDLIEEIESRLTIYRPDSLISRLNAAAHAAPFPVDPETFTLIERAAEIGARTSGAYDLACGALSQAWGFVHGPKRVPDAETLQAARECSGFRHVRLDSTARTLSFDRPGVVLNFGAIGKGYAVDRAVELIQQAPWPLSALVHASQSSVYALGSPPGRFGGRWPIALRNPINPDRPLGTLWLRNRALGTSGAAFQSFEHDGKRYSHLLDPRTGAPAESGPASLTVLASDATTADALSTALYLLGPDQAAATLARFPRAAALFIIGDRPDTVHLITFNLGPDDFEPVPGLAIASHSANR